MALGRIAWLPVLAAGCAVGGSTGVFIDPCASTERTLAPDEASVLGFSGEDVVAWYGDDAAVVADWFGRHSDTPGTDTIRMEVGALVGDIVETTYAPVDSADVEAHCERNDALHLTRSARFETTDGGVAGDGTLDFTLSALDMAHAELEGTAPAVTLSDARQAEVDAAVADLPPPDHVDLYVGHYDTFDFGAIQAEGPGYGVSVWKCDEQHHPGCVAWH